MRVGIVGGGIVGMSAAFHLSSHNGVEVLIVDQANIGNATSASAGILSPGNRFSSNDPILPLLKESHAYYPKLIADLEEAGESSTKYEKVGAIHVAIADDEVDSMPALLAQINTRFSTGFNHIGKAEMIDDKEARSLFPVLSPIRSAIYIPDAARIDGNLLRASLKGVVARRGGSIIYGNANLVAKEDKVIAININKQMVTVDKIILAAGAWSFVLAKQLGITIPIYPQRGIIIHLTSNENIMTNRCPTVMSFTHYILAFSAHNVVIGATREDCINYDYRATFGEIRELVNEGYRIAIGLDHFTLEKQTIGFRPISPDAKPFIGKVPGFQNVYIATGHGGYGLQAGPYSGVIIAKLALDQLVSIDLTPFEVGRFHPHY